MCRSETRKSAQLLLKKSLADGSKPEVGQDEDETFTETINSVQESDYFTEDSKRKFICESFKIDESEILNQDDTHKEIKMFMENFSVLALHPKHYGKTDA